MYYQSIMSKNHCLDIHVTHQTYRKHLISVDFVDNLNTKPTHEHMAYILYEYIFLHTILML